MSTVNIKRAIDHIRATTTIYTPVVELIVNAVQAIDELQRDDGKILARVQRARQPDLDRGLPEVTGFEIEDNGIGFTDGHRDSFDTLYTDLKIAEGGKGFGRFICLKYFESLEVESVYRTGQGFSCRSFTMGTDHDIIVNERVTSTAQCDTGTIVRLSGLKKVSGLDRTLSTIARVLVERLLPYFITESYVCPDIVLCESDGSGAIILNNFVSNEVSAFIQEIRLDDNTFTLSALDTQEEFLVRTFKFYAPKNHRSRVSLVAHRREVSSSVLHRYIPEFEDEFYDRKKKGDSPQERNYVIRAYAFGRYLDRHVSLERGGFEFAAENDLLFGIAQTDIERHAAELAVEAVRQEITSRQEKKRERVLAYVDEEAPWHKHVARNVDLREMPYRPTDEQIETHLQREKYSQERAIKQGVAKLLEETNLDNVRGNVGEIVGRIGDASKNDLIHYIATRRAILDIFGKSLEVDESGMYSKEGVVHDIVFPRRGDSETTSFDDHNLWILDERLNFTSYVSSDVALDDKGTDRPDLLAYDKCVLFRGDNEASNPVTIFELKRPQRDDFANPSSREDPIQQIVRYVGGILDGRYKTPQGRKMLVAENTPFYGFVVCDLTAKVETWLRREKDFKPMPDGMGWFQWIGNINLYVEVNSWDRVLKDARMRNRVFFEKLGI